MIGISSYFISKIIHLKISKITGTFKSLCFIVCVWFSFLFGRYIQFKGHAWRENTLSHIQPRYSQKSESPFNETHMSTYESRGLWGSKHDRQDDWRVFAGQYVTVYAWFHIEGARGGERDVGERVHT